MPLNRSECVEMAMSRMCGANAMKCSGSECRYVPTLERVYKLFRYVTSVYHECLVEKVLVEERDEEHVASQGGLFADGRCPLHAEYCERGDSVLVWEVSSLRRACPYELVGAYNMTRVSATLLLTDTNYMFKLSNETRMERGCHATRGLVHRTTAGLYIADEHFNLTTSDTMHYVNSLLVSNADYKDHRLSVAIGAARLDACRQCVDMLRLVGRLYADKYVRLECMTSSIANINTTTTTTSSDISRVFYVNGQRSLFALSSCERIDSLHVWLDDREDDDKCTTATSGGGGGGGGGFEFRVSFTSGVERRRVDAYLADFDIVRSRRAQCRQQRGDETRHRQQLANVSLQTSDGRYQLTRVSASGKVLVTPNTERIVRHLFADRVDGGGANGLGSEVLDFAHDSLVVRGLDMKRFLASSSLNQMFDYANVNGRKATAAATSQSAAATFLSSLPSQASSAALMASEASTSLFGEIKRLVFDQWSWLKTGVVHVAVSIGLIMAAIVLVLLVLKCLIVCCHTSCLTCVKGATSLIFDVLKRLAAALFASRPKGAHSTDLPLHTQHQQQQQQPLLVTI